MKTKFLAVNHLKLKLFLLFAFVFSATLGFLVAQSQKDSNAVSPAFSGFNAGYIISDYVMAEHTSMTESAIQNFLNSKNPCNEPVSSHPGIGNVTSNYSESSSYSWHAVNGKFVCLANERFNGESAAHIIYQAAQDYRINPKVLLVLLEKEQSLITDKFPNSVQYRSATGYGCPDTAACDSKYYGFKNQVRNSASFFRYILDNGSRYYPVGNNYVKYNPNSACGGSTVNIKNNATSALYQYTPYQPNAAALNGYNDGCGAFGNRNFYYFFTQWFGDIHATSESDSARKKIEATYQNINGKNTLGSATSGLHSSGKSFWIDYQKGAIVGSNATGYYESRGKIRTAWIAAGSISGKFGLPLSNIQYNKDTNTYWQDFQGGVLVGNDTNGYFDSSGDIRVAWAKMGYQKSALGLPTSGIQYDKSKGAFWQNYQNGVIIGAGKTGYYESRGKIRTAWIAAGSISGKFGLPLSNIQYNKDTNTYWQDFQGGVLVGNDTNGYFDSSGDIRVAWAKMGYQKSALGLPTSGIQYDKSKGAFWQNYQNGVIIGAGKTGYYESRGKIRTAWIAAGSISGKFGLPLSNIQYNKDTNTYWQDFQGGVLVGNDANGYFESRGAIREFWAKQGYQAGKLGLPTSNITTSGNIQVQKYQHGVIKYNTNTGKVWQE